MKKLTEYSTLKIVDSCTLKSESRFKYSISLFRIDLNVTVAVFVKMTLFINKGVRNRMHKWFIPKWFKEPSWKTTQNWEVIYGADSACLSSSGKSLQSDWLFQSFRAPVAEVQSALAPSSDFGYFTLLKDCWNLTLKEINVFLKLNSKRLLVKRSADLRSHTYESLKGVLTESEVGYMVKRIT